MVRTILFISHCLLASALLIAPSVGLAQPTPPPPGTFQKWPATPETPELKAERQQAEQAAASINQGRLNPQQKRQMLLNHPNPGIRAKAQEALRSKQQPRSSLDQPGQVAALGSLTALLNPLAPAVADAQVPFAVTLTGQAPYHATTGSYLNLRGTSVYAGKQGLTAFVLSHYPSNALIIGIEGALGVSCPEALCSALRHYP